MISLKLIYTAIYLAIYINAFPVKVPHYDILRAKEEVNYIDKDTSTYHDLSTGALGSDDFQSFNRFEHQPYVANGFIGSRIPNLGFGFTQDQNQNKTSSYLTNGWPLFDERFSGAFIQGFFDLEDRKFPSTNFPELYDKGYESVITVVPQWTDLKIRTTINGTEFRLTPLLSNQTDLVGNISNYNQELNLNDGIVTTSYQWLHKIDVRFTVILHREFETLGLVNLELTTAEKGIELEIENFIDFSTSKRCEFVEVGKTDEDTIYMTFQPHLVSETNATIYTRLNSDSIDLQQLNTTIDNLSQVVSQSLKVTLTPNQNYNLTKYVGISSTDHDAEPFQTAKNASLTELTFEELKIIHQQRWYDLKGQTHFRVPSSELVELTSELSLYHLLANQRSSSNGVTSALGVSGLSSDSYGGMQFWDTDLWMIPSIIPFAPEVAKLVSKYRVLMHSQLKQNAELEGKTGAVYPWTSGRYGNCTTTGPCFDYEYHINVDVVYSIWKLFLAGVLDDTYMKEEAFSLFEDAAEFFVEYVEYNLTLKKFTTRNLTDPDEYLNQVNNGLYTNVGISQMLKWTTLLARHLGLSTNDKWEQVSENMYLPKAENSQITLEYDTMNSSIAVKQADVIMIELFDDEDGALQKNFNYTKENQLQDLYYYSEHQAPQGPLMTFPVFSMVSSKLSESGCAATSYLMKSIKPFLRFPFLQMSEQNYDDYDANGGTHPLFPFLTGHGGVLQSVVYGLTGLRFEYNITAQDRIEPVLKFDPVALPCLPKGISVDNFQFQGVSLYVEVNDTSSLIYHHGNIDKTVTIEVDERNPLKGTYTLKPFESLHVGLYKAGKNIAGSITECSLKVVDSSEAIHGDVVETILDGDNSTIWQSTDKNSSFLVFDLGPETSVNVTKGLIIWGEIPAQKINLYSSSNDKDFNSEALLTDYPVEISSPYDIKAAQEIRYSTMRNHTSFEFNSTVELRFFKLEMIGSYDETAAPAIAEFNLF